MTSTADVEWEVCDVDGCNGSQSEDGSRCLAHAGLEERAAALDRVAATGDVDARGVTIGRELLRAILAALPGDSEDRPRFAIADFRSATFVDEVDFRNVMFGRIGWFDGATFEADARFDGAYFEHDAAFAATTFKGVAVFYRARVGRLASFANSRFAAAASFTSVVVEGDAEFPHAEFGARAEFHAASFMGQTSFVKTVFGGEAAFGPTYIEGALPAAAFAGEAQFLDCTFRDLARFVRVSFERDALFRSCRFETEAWFRRADFKRDADLSASGFASDAAFDHASFAGDLRLDEKTRFGTGDLTFAGATFHTTRHLGPLVSLGTVSFDDATFLQRADLDITADSLTLARSRFPQGVNVWLRWAEVAVDKAEFGAPSIISSALDESRHADSASPPPSAPADELPGEEALASRYAESPTRTPRPRLVSLRWALVGELTVSGLDLAPCRFHGVHHLEKLLLEGGSRFAPTPERRWLSHRLAIAEEHEWRAARASRGRRDGTHFGARLVSAGVRGPSRVQPTTAER